MFGWVCVYVDGDPIRTRVAATPGESHFYPGPFSVHVRDSLACPRRPINPSLRPTDLVLNLLLHTLEIHLHEDRTVRGMEHPSPR